MRGSLGEYHERRQYLGHGKSKVCYLLTERKVLKLREEHDQEPHLFRELQATGVYPKVHASAECRFGHQTWHAWVVDLAKPLDQTLKENDESYQRHPGLERRAEHSL